MKSAWTIMILLLAAALRLYGLESESLWYDEAIVWNRIQNSFLGMLTDWDSQRQGPLFTLLMKPWCAIFGEREAAMRLPAVLFGLLAVYAIMLIGQKFFGTRTAIFAGLLAAINPMLIHYSQDARPYTLLLSACLLSVLFLVRICREGAAFGLLAGFAVTTLATVYSHAYGPFLLIAQVMALAALYVEPSSKLRDRDTQKRLGIAFAGVMICYLPILLVFARTFLRKLENPSYAGAWIETPTVETLMKTQQQYWMDAFPSWLVVSVVVIGFAYIWLRHREERPALFVLASVVICFVIVPWLISLWITPIYFLRYTIPAAGVLLLLLGKVLAVLGKWVGAGLAALTILFSIPALSDYYTKIDKDPWRQTAEYLRDQAGKEDYFVLNPAWAKSPLRYYYPIDSADYSAPLNMQAYRKPERKHRRAWLISGYTHKLELNDSLYAELATWGKPGTTIRMHKVVDQNPGAYFVGRLEVTRFERMR